MGPCGEEHHLCSSRLSKPGVEGRLVSCTVSSLGAAPLAPRDADFMLGGCSSGSLAALSSRTGMRDAGPGDELCTTIAGVEAASGFLCWARSESLRERDRASWAGGGDLRRGEMGQWGVLSPELDPEAALTGLGTREGSCDNAAGASWGMFADDRARWMAAAEGTVAGGPGRLGPLFGLTSVLLLRDRRPALGSGPDTALRAGGRDGEVSREDNGEAAVDGEPDTLSERAPLSVWDRSGADPDALSAAAGACADAGAGAFEAAAAGVVVVGEVLEGSADSAAPVTERKPEPASVSSVIAGDDSAWGRGPASACC